jgi:hypothetical protein
MVALALAKFNATMRTAVLRKKLQEEKLGRGGGRGAWGHELSRPGTGEEIVGRGAVAELRSVTPSTVGLGGGWRAATSVPVESLSIEAMEKLSVFAVQQQLHKMEEERAEIEQQVE